jgi:hypothetical protein
MIEHTARPLAVVAFVLLAVGVTLARRHSDPPTGPGA